MSADFRAATVLSDEVVQDAAYNISGENGWRMSPTPGNDIPDKYVFTREEIAHFADAIARIAVAYQQHDAELRDMLVTVRPRHELITDLVQARKDIFDLRTELENIANSKRHDRKIFRNDTEWAEWAQSRAGWRTRPLDQKP